MGRHLDEGPRGSGVQPETAKDDQVNTVRIPITFRKRGGRKIVVAPQSRGWALPYSKEPTTQHLKRYLAEYDFRYNERSALGVEDAERMTKSVQGIVGKRLTYKDSSAVGG
jgi:hypothetical protein